MPAHSDPSSDPTPAQPVGSTAVGAHAASADRTDTAAVQPVPVGSADTTSAQPVAERTPTTPVATVPAPAPDVDRTRELGRDDAPREDVHSAGVAHADRAQVVAAQQARFGGISWGSAFFGWLSANGTAVILVALLSAAGLAFGLSDSVSSPDRAAESATSGIGLGAGIALLVALFLAYLAGGYVAGRMARFDGVKQGVAVWVIGLAVVLLLALAGLVFGSQYNVLAELDLPRIPVDEGTATTAGIIALVAILVVTLLGAILGGVLGTRYHRKVDRVGFDAI